MKFGDLVRKHRKQKGLSAVQLAEEIGVSQGTISHIETGRRNPSDKIMARLFHVLEIPKKDMDDFTNSITLKPDNEGVLASKNIVFNGHFINLSINITAIAKSINELKTENEKALADTFYTLEGKDYINEFEKFIKEHESEIDIRLKSYHDKELRSSLQSILESRADADAFFDKKSN
ncbi:helix-turn-helix transcriptional regulator [Halalkalibacter okhensis]|uniref:helix-turn-helix transcriptional regulator n=1 Tax=Halalkalibacter okhensis TaxID=333138 RepID=UPI00068BA893|nr:helix-turn-helix transcriptional regulator [Halalkalibacter okhensis]